MRKALLLLLVCVNLAVSAKDYYVSSTGNDSADGLSSSTAWKTISKVNSVSSLFNPGDKILFRRGDVFAGTLIMSKSGVAGNPITIGAYGSGANPVITGFITISDWDSYGGGIYYKSVSCESSPNIVTVNGVNTPIGRWPNSDYLTIDSHSSNRSITDSELPSSPNWTGAEVVIRKQPYIWDRNKITSHSGSTISYTSGSNYSAKDGYGYFIQNDIKTLDRQGEWYHNGTNFYMHFGSSSPENYSVKISVRDILINVDKVNYITIENISLEGANKYAVQVRDAGYITIQNCNINFTGNTAIYGPFWGSSPNCKIINNTISNSNNNAITLNSDHTNATISGNNIKNTGMIVGMGESGDGTYKGIYASGDNGIIQYNTVENTGYVGIDFFGNNTTVAYNFVNNFNLVKNDGGGIYTYTGTKTPRYGQKVTNNIILNGIGYGKGIPDNEVHASGIYTDDRSRSILIADNTIANCNSSGIFIHNAHEIDITGNTLYNNGSARLDYGSQILFVHDSYSPDDPIRNLKINNNVFFARTKAQSVICFMTMDSDIPRFGTADNNYYAKPIDNTYIARTWNAGWWSTATMRSLSNWQSFTGQDKNSRIAPISVDNENKIKFEYNATSSNKVISLDGSYIDVKGTKYSGSITLQPYSSVVLMVDPNPSAPPTVPVYVSSAIENATPAKLEMTYNLSLANIVPAASAFTVMVNSSARAVSSVAVSGTKVTLTLASPVAYGNTVTVAYKKPSSNPLQTAAGGQAATISAQNVTNRVAAPAQTPPPVPVYVSSAIENATPTKLEMTYNLNLANIVPAASAFTVMVNSSARAVSSVAVSGTKVTLTLASPVAYGNTVTVAYKKPSSNPLQTAAGGQAATISAQSVTNRVAAPAQTPPPVPVYVSSAIENTAPSKLEMTYNLSLANIVPPVSAFTVKVNSSTRSVSSVAVSGTKVVLTLSSPVAYGDNVTVAYTKPSSKPLQTTAGGQAATISAKAVTNRVAIANAPPVVVVTSPKTSYSGFVSEISAAGSYDTNKDNLTFSWTAQSTVPISSRSGPTIEFLAPIVSEPTTVQFTVKVSDGKVTQSKVIPVEILPYKPELEVAEVVNVEASSYHSPNYPHNVVDGNIGTMWAANGTGEYLIIELKEPFSVQHVKLAFQPGQKKESYFDLSGSNDMVKWEPILIKSVSCDFSGNLQVFDFPHAKAEREYRYIKLTGQGNLSDNWNYISELRIYGYRHRNPESYENLAVKVYPNPASEVVNIRIDESSLSIDFIRIVHLSGRTVYINNRLGEGTRLFNIPINLANGTYVIQMGKGNLTLFTQKLIVQN